LKESEDNLSFIRDFITESDKKPLFKSMLSKVSEFRLEIVVVFTVKVVSVSDYEEYITNLKVA
jgi:hypothetical protein